MMKWTFLFAILMIMTHQSHAWNIGSKSRTTGSTIHTTYFLTPKNGSFQVHASAYVGFLVNGLCQYATVYDIGSDTLQTGDHVDIDGFALKSLVGGGYSCMTIYYTSQQVVRETFQLYFDGINYDLSQPATAEVIIL